MANDAYPPTACGYDCTIVTNDSYITSSQPAWSSAPLASNSSFLPFSTLSQFLSKTIPSTSAAPLGLGAFESMLAPYI